MHSTFIFCVSLFIPRTTHELHIHTIRSHPVIYYTEIMHHDSHKTPRSETNSTLTNVNTREELLEASPKGPRLEHFKALAGPRNRRTLGIHGLVSRPFRLENLLRLFGKKQKINETNTNNPWGSKSPSNSLFTRRPHTSQQGLRKHGMRPPYALTTISNAQYPFPCFKPSLAPSNQLSHPKKRQPSISD